MKVAFRGQPASRYSTLYVAIHRNSQYFRELEPSYSGIGMG